MEMRARLRVHGQPICACADIGLQITIGMLDHQVNVERQIGRLASTRGDNGTDGDVRHEMAVHDIDMNPVGSPRFDRLDFVRQA